MLENTDVDAACYAIRRINHFLGVLQVIETEFGRATSANGLSWEIEVSERIELDQAGSDIPEQQNNYYHHGLWSEEQGLIQRPLSLTDKGEDFFAQGEYVISQVRKFSAYLPFGLKDCIEYWLLDKNDQQPLALLASTTNENLLPEPLPKYWSCCLGLKGVHGQCRFPGTDELEFLVKERAGFNRRTAWFQRRPNGDGIDLNSGDVFPGGYFPPYLIQTKWIEAMHGGLVNDYIKWVAPSLLTLDLQAQERRFLEESLHVQAVSVEHLWRLYPDVLNETLINPARVQSRMQSAELK